MHFHILGAVNGPLPSSGVKPGSPSPTHTRIYSHPLKDRTREVKEVTEPIAGTSLQENGILSLREKNEAWAEGWGTAPGISNVYTLEGVGRRKGLFQR